MAECVLSCLAKRQQKSKMKKQLTIQKLMNPEMNSLALILVKSGGDNKHSRVKEPGQLLSPYQKYLIRTSGFESEMDKIGSQIYQRVFEKNPSIKLHFNVNENISDKKLIKTKQFRMQAYQIMTVVHKSVGKIDKLDKVKSSLANLGARHAQYVSSYILQSADWQLFNQAMFFALTNSQKMMPTTNEKLLDFQEAWSAVINYITDAMQEGYEKAITYKINKSGDSDQSDLLNIKKIYTEGCKTTQNSVANEENHLAAKVSIGREGQPIGIDLKLPSTPTQQRAKLFVKNKSLTMLL